MNWDFNRDGEQMGWPTPQSGGPREDFEFGALGPGNLSERNVSPVGFGDMMDSIGNAFSDLFGFINRGTDPDQIRRETYDYLIRHGLTPDAAAARAGIVASRANRTRTVIDFTVPQSPEDVAFGAAGGPFAKPVRKLGMGVYRLLEGRDQEPQIPDGGQQQVPEEVAQPSDPNDPSMIDGSDSVTRSEGPAPAFDQDIPFGGDGEDSLPALDPRITLMAS